MRDLQADLELCNKATPGPWERNEKPSFGDWWVQHGNQHICLLPSDKKGTYFGDMFKVNADFIAAAREGWPHAIGRATNAEAEVERYKLMVNSITGGLDEAIETIHYLEAENALLHKVAIAARALVPSEMYQYIRHLFDLKRILDEYDEAKGGQE